MVVWTRIEGGRCRRLAVCEGSLEWQASADHGFNTPQIRGPTPDRRARSTIIDAALVLQPPAGIGYRCETTVEISLNQRAATHHRWLVDSFELDYIQKVHLT